MDEEGFGAKWMQFIALTESSETNIIYPSFCKNHGVYKTIGRKTHVEYIHIHHSHWSGFLINKKLVAAN